ncbi:MAG TPA: PatB family C-S lyase [Clostridiales bacterium]|nr:PatB family C-S lyase [Clostridiales bacterium]
MNQKIAEEIALYDRYATDSEKWDGLESVFGKTNLLPLWVADMDFRSPLAVREALQTAAKNGVFGYMIPPKAYVESFIRWEKERHSYAVKEDWLRTTDSVVSGIHQLIFALTGEGDGIMAITPVYRPLFGAIEKTGRTPVISELSEEKGRYRLNFDDIEKKITANHIKMLLFCSPHNPVGRVWREEELTKIVEICKNHNVIIVSDEIHQDIVAKDQRHIPLATVGGYGEGVITVTSASKSFNLAGLKNAFLVIEDPLFRQKHGDFCAKMGLHEGNTFGYLAATAAYTEGQDWLDTVLEIIYRNDALLQEALHPFADVTLSPLEGTYLTWLDLKNIVSPGELRYFMEKEAGLAVNYGSWFFPEGREDTHIRLNLAAPTATIEKALAKLTAALVRHV